MTTATASPAKSTATASATKTASTTSTGVPASPENASAEEHIAALRRRLDEIDQKLIELWRERAAISQEVGQTRLAAGGTRLVLAREQEILHRFREALGSDGTQLALLLLRAGRGKLV
jgi:chorismate mutase